MSRHRSSVGLRWPSKRIAALHRLPIRSVLAARCALRCAPMAARSLRHLIGDATLVQPQGFPAAQVQRQVVAFHLGVGFELSHHFSRDRRILADTLVERHPGAVFLGGDAGSARLGTGRIQGHGVSPWLREVRTGPIGRRQSPRG
ncbi:hypothetical protein [Verminephrobacter eiseniae]|uniref:hypothetical protein n=1 Tax=Verminephrobacter eiseniae TaxID=364317 RepID=UPI002236FEC3|nr:hypothetical protein [Verminephrobacter eiseniae]